MTNMIFQHTWRNVFAPFVPELSGYLTKTETRRLIKPLETLKLRPLLGVAVFTQQSRIRFGVNSLYPVMPCRGASGAKSVGLIRITSIIRQDVRAITDSQAHAEGFLTIAEFLHVWQLINDPKALHDPEHKCPEAKYHAWAITFKVEDVCMDAIYQSLEREDAQKASAS